MSEDKDLERIANQREELDGQVAEQVQRDRDGRERPEGPRTAVRK